MVGDDKGCMQSGNVSLPPVASHSSSWYGVSSADFGYLPSTCSLPGDSRPEVLGEPLQHNDSLQGSLGLCAASFGLRSETNIGTASTSFPLCNFKNSAEPGPYGELWSLDASGHGSLGQYLTFSASDGSQRDLEYVPLSNQAIEPRKSHSNSTLLDCITESTVLNESQTTIDSCFDPASNSLLTTSSETSSSQLFFTGGPCLDTGSSSFRPITNFDHVDQTSTEFGCTGDSLHCPFPPCGKVFTRRYLYNKHIKFHTRPYNCPLCPQHYVTRRDMSRHIAVAHHQPSTVYHCEVPGCKYGQQSLGRGMFFTRKDNFARHMRKAHCEQAPPG